MEPLEKFRLDQFKMWYYMYKEYGERYRRMLIEAEKLCLKLTA